MSYWYELLTYTRQGKLVRRGFYCTEKAMLKGKNLQDKYL